MPSANSDDGYPTFQLNRPRFDQDYYYPIRQQLLQYSGSGSIRVHNACVNYANRNATKPTPPSRFIAGYVGAVTTAVSIAVGLNVLIKRANSFSPTTKLLVQRFVPFPAVAAASTFNVLLMRNNELSTGIQVVDRNDNVIGSSKIAARKALQETAMTRIFLPAPILIIPPALMAMLEKTKFLKTNPRLHLPINAFLVTACFGLALPVAIALFPQYSKVCNDPYLLVYSSRSTFHFFCR
ncbi:hypothetical protein FSP39_007761 [Pinctada imbricata]|uniref:Uncharacterized protein n=1 Tax=Pinctada imbricata TaxID=66713 RepID=A0AA89C4X5_PINIB|nr:hypothetical protein FSP39_007761 [Pinctada imbricata]